MDFTEQPKHNGTEPAKKITVLIGQWGLFDQCRE